MVDLNSLKNSLRRIKLESAGRNSGQSQSYTKAEEELASAVSRVVLTVTGHKEFDELDEEVCKALESLANEGKVEDRDVPSLCRAVYREIEKARLTNPETLSQFPKVKEGERVQRDFTSLNLLFRKAFKAFGYSGEVLQNIFPSYYGGKKKKEKREAS